MRELFEKIGHLRKFFVFRLFGMLFAGVLTRWALLGWERNKTYWIQNARGHRERMVRGDIRGRLGVEWCEWT